MKRRRAFRLKRQSTLDPFTWSVFVTLVLSLFFKRIVDIWGSVTPRDCYELPVNFMGASGAFDGPMEVILLIGLAAIILLLTQAVSAIVSTQTTLTFWALWSVNLLLAGLLVWSFLMAWAFFNPGAAQAQPIFAATKILQPAPRYYRSLAPLDLPPESYGDWVWNDAANGWTNEAYGLLQRYEIVRDCKLIDRTRAQLALLYGAHNPDRVVIADLEPGDLDQSAHGFVLYDLDGNYLTTLGGPFEMESAKTRARDTAYDPVRAAMSPEEARRRYEAWIDTRYLPPQQRAPQFPRIPKEKIDEIVAESWGDERPSWHEAD